MRTYRSLAWRILIPIVLLTLMIPLPATAGRNANGALIVHTNDAVTYTGTADYCATSFLPASCEAAITRTDKDEDTPAVIWLLAAFSDTSSPAVTTIQFGIEHNLPANEGYFEAYGKCAELEMPDAGWPETGFGNLVSFGSTAMTDLLFPFYWLAAYGFEGAYLRTTVYPSTDEAKFVDDSNPPTEDSVARFGIVRWGLEGANNCPSIPMGHEIYNTNGDVLETDESVTDDFTCLCPLDSGPIVYYVDVRHDDSFSFTLERYSGSWVSAVQLEYYNATTNSMVGFDIVTLTGFQPESVGPHSFSSNEGLLKVVITKVLGSGTIRFYPSEDTPDNIDIELFNAKPVTTAPGSAFFVLWIPSTAAVIRIAPMTSCPGSCSHTLYNWSGYPVATGPASQWLVVPSIPTSERERPWIFSLLNQGGVACDGPVTVEFEDAYGNCWTPEFAFQPNRTLPPRGELPHNAVVAIDGTDALFVPSGTGRDTYPMSAIPDCDEVHGDIRLYSRQWYRFVIYPHTTRSVVLHNYSGLDSGLVEKKLYGTRFLGHNVELIHAATSA